MKNIFGVQNAAGIASAFEEVSEQKKIKAQNIQDLFLQAKKIFAKF